jgi:hypothetical protein
LRITIDIFSGRPNPTLELSDKESRDAWGLLARTRPLERGEPGVPPAPTLGYRGLIVEQVGAMNRALPRAFRIADGVVLGEGQPLVAEDAFEPFVFDPARLRRIGPGSEIEPLLRREFLRYRRTKKLWPWPALKPRPLRLKCRCAPLYEPAWWNDGGQRQAGNNCYNYGANHRTDTFHQVAGGSQPGAAAGAMYTSITGPAVKAAAIADGLIDKPEADNKCPGEGHLVALVIAPGYDFHWYRKGRSGHWSHKPGSTPAITVDNSGQAIADPRTADRGMYSQFTTFMVVMHGHVKIK